MKGMLKHSVAFNQAWTSYCLAYAEGCSDVTQHEEAFIAEFAEHAASLIQAELQAKGVGNPTTEGVQASSVPAPWQKRKAAEPAPSAPAEKKKVTVKKAVAIKVKAMNASATLTSPIRLGAVATALSEIAEATQLDILSLLEEQAADIDDPTEFLRSQALAMLSAAEEA